MKTQKIIKTNLSQYSDKIPIKINNENEKTEEIIYNVLTSRENLTYIRTNTDKIINTFNNDESNVINNGINDINMITSRSTHSSNLEKKLIKPNSESNFNNVNSKKKLFKPSTSKLRINTNNKNNTNISNNKENKKYHMKILHLNGNYKIAKFFPERQKKIDLQDDFTPTNENKLIKESVKYDEENNSKGTQTPVTQTNFWKYKFKVKKPASSKLF